MTPLDLALTAAGLYLVADALTTGPVARGLSRVTGTSTPGAPMHYPAYAWDLAPGAILDDGHDVLLPSRVVGVVPEEHVGPPQWRIKLQPIDGGAAYVIRADRYALFDVREVTP